MEYLHIHTQETLLKKENNLLLVDDIVVYDSHQQITSMNQI